MNSRYEIIRKTDTGQFTKPEYAGGGQCGRTGDQAGI